jgi:MFS family permease
MLAIGAAGSNGVLIAALLVSSTGAGICFTPAMTMLSETAEAGSLHQGLAAGLSNMAWAIGQVLGGLAGGALAQAAGYALPSIAVAVVLAATAAYSLRGPLPDALAPRPSG